MAAADTARLIASLELKDQFTPGLAKAGSALGRFDARLSRTEGRAFRAGQQIGTGIKNAGKLAVVGVGLLATQVGLGLASLVKLEQAQAQTAAVLKSTGQAAGVTAKQVGILAEKYESFNATVGDETIRETENLLLTFTNVRKKAFEPALAAILDMNTAMGKGPEGLTTTAIQVGKALNDPAKGFTALRRVGVSFTAQQEKRIKALQKEGKLYEAQKIILAELDKEFGGSFLAQGDTTAGKVAKFTDSIEDLQRSLATALLPAIGNVADELSTFLQDPAVIRGASELGVQIGNLFSRENVGKGIGALREVFQFAREVAPVVAAAAQTMGKFVSTAVSAFKSLPPDIQRLAVAGFAINKLTGGLVTNIAGGLISSVLKQLVSGVVKVNGAVVHVSGPVAGGLPGGGAAGGKGPGVVGGLVLATGVLVAIEEAVKAGVEKGALNTDLGTKGLNAAEIAAYKYYTSTVPEQQVALKKLGYLPTKADFDSAMAKLGQAVKADATPKNTRRDSPEWRQWSTDKFNSVVTSVENLRSAIGPSLSKLPGKLDTIATNTIAAGVTAKNASAVVADKTIEAGVKAKNATDTAKAQAASSAMIQQALLLSQMATTRVTASATQGSVRGVAPPIVSAIRAARPQTYVNVHIQATHVTKAVTVQNRYGPGNGSSGQDQRSGELEF